MRRRLPLILARHYLSAMTYFVEPNAVLVLFARGVQFLDMFYRMTMVHEEDLNPFDVIQSDEWLQTRR